MTPFGARVRALRQARGISLKQMAADMNVSSAYLSALEHGQRGKPAPGLVMQIAGYFGCIWDEAEELKDLADLSHPKVTLDSSGLSPDHTELANRLGQALRSMSQDQARHLLAELSKLLALAERTP